MSAYPRALETDYPNLRNLLAADYAALPAEDIEALMESVTGESAERYEAELEEIFGGIGRALSAAARDAGRVASRAAPAIATVGGGALQGALAGAPLGLPGIIAGAAVGGTGAGLSRYGRGAARGVGGALSGITGLAGQFSGAGRVGTAVAPLISGLAGGNTRGAAGAAVNALGSLLGGQGGAAVNALSGLLGGRGGGANALGALASVFGGNSAIGQLVSLLQRPEARQALEAQRLRTLSPTQPIGRSTIPVGAAQTPVPVSAITNLVGQLANQAAAEAAALSDGAEGELRYMLDEAGEFVGDPALDMDRAARVWDLLNDAQAQRLLGLLALREQADEAYEEAEPYEHFGMVESAYYDAIELAESYATPTEDLDELLMGSDDEELTGDFGEYEEYEHDGYI
jgi:hypothetical protein